MNPTWIDMVSSGMLSPMPPQIPAPTSHPPSLRLLRLHLYWGEVGRRWSVVDFLILSPSVWDLQIHVEPWSSFCLVQNHSLLILSPLTLSPPSLSLTTQNSPFPLCVQYSLSACSLSLSVCLSPSLSVSLSAVLLLKSVLFCLVSCLLSLPFLSVCL